MFCWKTERSPHINCIAHKKVSPLQFESLSRDCNSAGHSALVNSEQLDIPKVQSKIASLRFLLQIKSEQGDRLPRYVKLLIDMLVRDETG